MAREFADCILFSATVFSAEQALKEARARKLLRSARPFVRAVPGGWLATDGAEGCLHERDGRVAYDFCDLCRGVKIGFKREGG